MHDPIDIINAMGYRVVWVKDFDHQVFVIDVANVVLIDPAVERPAAARFALALLTHPSDQSPAIPEAS